MMERRPPRLSGLEIENHFDFFARGEAAAAAVIAVVVVR
jgi:hypothetical protein